MADRRQTGDGVSPGNDVDPATCLHRRIDRARGLTDPPVILSDWCRTCHTYWKGGRPDA